MKEKLKTEGESIEDVARLVGVSPRMLRYWEELGLIFPKRTKGNQRRYSPEELRIISLIKTLTYEYEMSTAEIGIIQKLGCKDLYLARLSNEGVEPDEDPVWLIILLEGLYAKLVGDRTLEQLDWKISKR